MILDSLRAILDSYSDVIIRVEDTNIGTAQKIRITIKDGSFIDIWRSDSGRYSYHWERKHVNGSIYRFNNAPHHKDVETFPDHLHYGTEDNVVAFDISSDLNSAIAQVLDLVRRTLVS